MNVTKKIAHALFIIILAAIFYCYEFMLQSSPGVITNELLHDFALNAASLSVLAAFFFYAYAPTQLAGGVLYDRFGPRILITAASLICALGTLSFAFGNSFEYLALGRFLMGLGGAFSFVGVLVLASRWLPEKYFAMVVGLLQSLGAIAAICGQVPLSIAVDHYGWRTCFHVLFYAGLVISFCVWLCIRDWPEGNAPAKDEIHHTKHSSIKTGLKAVFAKTQTYWSALYSFAIWAPITVFAALWGIPYISVLYHIPITQASTLGMMVWIGIGISSPLIGTWSTFIKKRKLPLVISGAVGVLASLALLYIAMPLWVMYIALLIFGFGAAGQSLIFALVQDNNNPESVGTALGFNNLAVVAGGAICQPLTGFLLKLHWSGATKNGVPIYDVSDFKQALIVLPICFAIAFVVSVLFLRETNAKPQN
jgi:MFS family permease